MKRRKIKKSSISGFHKLETNEKISIIRNFSGLEKGDAKLLKRECALDLEKAQKMIENVITTYQLPYGIATNFRINKKEYFIPMVIEEPSVIAAASHAAKLTRPEGFFAKSDEPLMAGQIQLVGVKNIKSAMKIIARKKNEIKNIANCRDSVMISLGGGLRGVESRAIDTARGKMLIVHLIVDVRDAMGANCINTMCEAVAPFLEKITGGKSVVKIISNFADRRVARARCVWKKEVIGEDVINGILDAYEFAKNDVYRCTTNNKGIMNGIDAVAIATGNDFRALEAGAHAYASRSGRYQPLAKYEKDSNGNLIGTLEVPIAAGIVGGATRTHPLARLSIKMLGVDSAQELSQVMVCVGLANNFAALRAMVTEGIQKGHMKLHAKNIAIIAGAEGKLIDLVEERMIRENDIRVSTAARILKEIKWELRKKRIRLVERKIKKKLRRSKK